MDFTTWITGTVDSLLIAPYRLPENPLLGWWLGTCILALWATLLGEITIALAYKVNKFRIKELGKEMTDLHDKSINALKSGDKPAFKAINKLANEAFGKKFFLQIAMACASLWPVACALGWMQIRFSEIRFPLAFRVPLVGESVAYPFIFIPLYILTRILFGKIKNILHLSRL